MKRIIDSHAHIDMMFKYSHDKLYWYQNNKITVLSWSFCKHIKNNKQLLNYLKYQGSFLKKIEQELGIHIYYLTGIHPRNIVKNLEIDDALNILVSNLSNKKCLGIGEIGLEHITRLEIEVFMSQLNLISKIKNDKLKIGIHTPRNNKYKATVEILKILEKYSNLHDKIIIDHCDISILPIVIKNDYLAGITIAPFKTSLTELSKIIYKYEHKLSHIMCNSDNGGEFSQYFFNVANTKKNLNKEVKNKLFFETANDFFDFS